MDIKDIVKEKYGQLATNVSAGKETVSVGCCGNSAASPCCEPSTAVTSCCGSTSAAPCCGGDSITAHLDAITSNLYAAEQTSTLPEKAVQASLGCGNPTALITLHQGQTVLDLGSGGGIDVLLSARRVGPTGKVYGLDMTDAMLDLARANQARAGITNIEFIKGEIEHIPLPDASVDVIISNCVINLSADKAQVLREAFRVLKPGGRFAVSDIVVDGDVPANIRQHVELWIGCVAGALQATEYRSLLNAAGFEGIDIEPTRIYRAADARSLFEGQGLDIEVLRRADGRQVHERLRSGHQSHFVSAPTVLFVCVHNAGRSQMAEAFFNQAVRERSLPWVGESAGTIAAGSVNPLARTVMTEMGLTLDHQSPKLLRQPMDETASRVVHGVRCRRRCLPRPLHCHGRLGAGRPGRPTDSRCRCHATSAVWLGDRPYADH